MERVHLYMSQVGHLHLEICLGIYSRATTIKIGPAPPIK